MTAVCETCEDLTLKRQYSACLEELETSSGNGCDACSLLFQAASIAIKDLHGRLDLLGVPKEDLLVRWSLSSSRKTFRLQVVNLEEREEDVSLPAVQLHTASGTSSKWKSIGSAGFVTADSGSDDCVTKIKSWLQICQSEHPKCNSIRSEWAHRLPVPAKRLIDVGNSTRQPRLVEETVIRGYYATLSHCWGSSSPLMTTKATLEQRLRGISMEELPPTFKDAIKLVRALNLKYIWIDSLCICQDDEKEWRQEASRMNLIYGSSYLTIAATAASDSTKGVFLQRAESYLIPGTNVYVRKRIDHLIFREAVVHTLDDAIQSHKYPLFQRGWCLQERLLSNRILHFTTDEMVWQCRSYDHCECYGIQTLDNLRSSRLLTSRLKYNRVIEGNSGSDIWTIWREVVEDYCSTQLTKDSDHLPALSGVAAKFGLSGAGTYIAGLWHKPGALSLGSSPLFLDLLWKSSNAQARRPQVKVAPSFSWASRMGPIKYRSNARDGQMQYLNYARNGKLKHIDKCIFVVQLTQLWDTFDRFSDAPNAKLEIRCQLIPCSLKNEDGFSKISLGVGFTYEMTPDVTDTSPRGKNVELFCMPVAAYESRAASSNVFDGLVLAQVNVGTYQRVGLVEGVSERWLDKSGHESIVLV